MEGNTRTWFTPKQRAELWEQLSRHLSFFVSLVLNLFAIVGVPLLMRQSPRTKTRQFGAICTTPGNPDLNSFVQAYGSWFDGYADGSRYPRTRQR